MRKLLEKGMAIVLIIFFIGFIFIGMYETVTLPKEDFSYYENRELAKKPTYSWVDLENGSYTRDLEHWLGDHVAWREEILRYKTILDIYFLKRPVVNETVIRGNVLLPWKDYEVIEKKKIEKSAVEIGKNLRSHVMVTEENGGKFYYVAVPCQYVCFQNKYPKYLNNRENYTAVSRNALFTQLKKQNVEYIDMLDVYKKVGGLEKFSSKVDNHFNIYGAYETYKEIMEKVKLNFPDIDVLEDGEYMVETLPNPYIGSRGRKLFGVIPSQEKISIMEPLKQIPFERWNNGYHGTSTIFKLPENTKEDVFYTVFMGGDFGNTQIKTNRPKLPSILIYGDSFTNGVESIIWYSFNRMDSLDYRHYKEKSLNEYIEEMKPDIVVCIRDYEAMLLPDDNGQ